MKEQPVYPGTLSAEALLQQARRAMKKGHKEQARSLYASLLNRFPGHPAARKARQQIRKLAARPDQQALQQLSACYASGRLAEAEQLCLRLLQQYPDFVFLLNVLGTIYLDSGRVEQALQAYDAGLGKAPEDPDLLENKGIALQQAGQHESAIRCFRQALSRKGPDAGLAFCLGNAYKALGQNEQAIACYQQALAIRDDYPEAHFNLANTLKSQGRMSAAWQHYARVIQLWPEYVPACINACSVLIDLGRKDEAIGLLEKAVHLDPDCEEGRYLLGALRGEQIEHPPDSYVRTVFDHYAERFDHHLVSELGYQAPQVLRGIVDTLFPDRMFARMMDLGCGTGLSGQAFLDKVQRLSGIDLSEEMIRQAEKKGIYQQLYTGHVEERLTEIDTCFELFLATDVLIYIGACERLFRLVRQRCAPGGLFAFSTEFLPDQDGFLLRESGRYAHSHAYILSTSHQAGFRLLHFSRFNLRKEEDQWLTGGAYVMQCRSEGEGSRA